MSLHVNEDVDFQRREWRAQRIGWALFAAIIVAALLGLAGPGPLSHSTAASADGSVVVRYLRFARAGGTAGMTVEVAARHVQEGTLTLRVSQPFLSSFEAQQITPDPAEAAIDGEWVAYMFSVAGEPGQMRVLFDLQPEAMGSVRGAVAVGDQVAEFRHYVYP